MNSLFDPLNLILLAIAVVVFWKLRSVLGTRTGLERPPAEPVVLKPRTAPGPQAETSPPLGVDDREPPKPVWHGYAEEGSATAKALEAIAQKSPDFKVGPFIEGAKVAYEMVLQAYADGNKQALKPLLGPDVMQSFSAAIDRRKAEGSRFVFQFVGVNTATLTRADLIVWLHPIYWYSVPGLLKHWFDTVLTRGWAYGKGGEALRGKHCLWAATTGGDELAYTPAGMHRKPFPEFHSPIEMTARFCGMVWEEPFIVHGAHTVNEADLAAAAQAFRARIAEFAGKDAS